MAEKIKVVIDRARWRTGGDSCASGHGATLLCNSEGYKCCLGFIIEAFDSCIDIKNRSSPADVHEFKLLKNSGLIVCEDNNAIIDSQLARDAMRANDDADPHMSQGWREAEIKDLFAESIFEIEFAGEYEE